MQTKQLELRLWPALLLTYLVVRFFFTRWLDGLGAYVISTLLFSYAHLHALWFVPVEVQAFVMYQAAYTLFLAAACGYAVLKYRSLAGAMLVHFLFNLGFYLGYLF